MLISHFLSYLVRSLPLELNGTGTLPVSPVLEMSGSLLFFHRIWKLVRPCFHFHRILNIESGSIRDNIPSKYSADYLSIISF